MTVDTVTQIFNKMKNEWDKVMDEFIVPKQLVWEIQRRYSTDTEKNRACADYYVNCHPGASWEDLTGTLYVKKEFAAARESKTFISTGRYILYCICSNIIATLI